MTLYVSENHGVDNTTDDGKAILAALNNVRSVFPSVTTVNFDADGRWLFTDDDANEPDFAHAAIDVGVLEDAADTVKDFPATFAVY